MIILNESPELYAFRNRLCVWKQLILEKLQWEIKLVCRLLSEGPAAPLHEIHPHLPCPVLSKIPSMRETSHVSGSVPI